MYPQWCTEHSSCDNCYSSWERVKAVVQEELIQWGWIDVQFGRDDI